MIGTGTMSLDCIRLRVRKLKPAIRFYSALFGWPVVKELYDGEIYLFNMANGCKLLLDDIRHADIHEPQAQPAAILIASDLEMAHERSLRMDFAYVSPIETGIEFPHFICRDRDHNEFAVSGQPFGYPGAEGFAGEGPFEPKLSCVSIRVGDIRQATAFYSEWLGTPLHVGREAAEDCRRFILSGDKSLDLTANSEGRFPPSSILRLHTHDLPGAWRRIKEIGGGTTASMKENESGLPLCFQDPDGNTLAVELLP